MKIFLSLLLLLPLLTTAYSAEHGGKEMKTKEHGGTEMKAKEHGGTEMKAKAKEHGGKALSD